MSVERGADAVAGARDHLRVATERLPEMIADLGALVRVESPSDDHVAVAASAAAVAALIERRLGVRPETVVVQGCTHLRLRFGRPRLLLLAHHDTVWPLGSIADHPFEVTDGVIRGPGCFDMKAGLVQGIHALEMIIRREGVAALDGVSLLVTGDEEVHSPTSRALIEDEARACAAVLVGEPAAPDGALKVARKGATSFEVFATGRAAHAGLEPERGVNALLELAHQAIEIAAIADPSVGTTVVPTVVSAGTTVNTVPASGRLLVDSRAATASEQERVTAALHRLVPLLEGSEIVVSTVSRRPPMERQASAALFERAAGIARIQGMDERLGPLRGVEVGGASDGNLTAGLGVRTLDGLGAVGGGAHSADEHVLADRMPERTALLAALIEELLTGVRASESEVSDLSP